MNTNGAAGIKEIWLLVNIVQIFVTSLPYYLQKIVVLVLLN